MNTETTNQTETNPKLLALAKYLDVNPSELSESSYDESLIELGNQEYLVLTDSEADERCAGNIKESLWAFNASFIIEHSRADWSQELEKSIQETQIKLCESANSFVEALIDDLNAFIQDAISADGRGHFLSSYDGEENEQNEYFIYRQN